MGEEVIKLEMKSRFIPFGLFILMIFIFFLILIVYLILDFSITFSRIFPLIVLIVAEPVILRFLYGWSRKGEMVINDSGMTTSWGPRKKTEFEWTDIAEIKKTNIDGEILVIVFSKPGGIQIISSSRVPLREVRRSYKFLEDLVIRKNLDIKVWEEIPEN